MAYKYDRLHVECVINSKTKEHLRRREMIFSYNGCAVRLTQELTNSTVLGIYYSAQVIPAYSCDECSSYPPEWADDMSVVLKAVKQFAEKSKPHWEKHCTKGKTREEDVYMFEVIELKTPLYAVMKDSEEELNDLITKFFVDKAREAGLEIRTDIEVEFRKSKWVI